MITVAAAGADLEFAMDEIITSFKASRSWDEIGVTYGSSGNLYTRIRQGAPVDIFFSADVGFANALNDKGLAATAPSCMQSAASFRGVRYAMPAK